MQFRPRLTACMFAVVIAGLSPVAAGQGDPLFILASPQLLSAPRAVANPSPVTTLNSFLSYTAMTSGPGDASVYVVGRLRAATTTYVLQQAGAGVLQTLHTYANMPGHVGDVALDDAGELLYLVHDGTLGLYTAAVGAPLVRTVPLPSSLRSAAAFAEDHQSGDWFLLDAQGAVVRVARDGSSVVSVAKVDSSSGGGDLVVDPLTGDVLVAVIDDIFRVDPVTKSVKNVYRVPPQGSLVPFVFGLSFDPVTRGYAYSGYHIQGHNAAGFYGMLDRHGAPVFLSPTNVLAAFIATESPFRPFTPLTAPVRGTTYKVGLRLRGHEGSAYQAAFALSTIPGIPVSAGTIPLTPDPMLVLSLSGLPLFRNLSGTLDAGGRATVEVDLLPIPATKGVRLHLAAVALGGGAITAIFGPHSFTIR